MQVNAHDCSHVTLQGDIASVRSSLQAGLTSV